MGPNMEKIRQININRAMHAEQMDQKGKYEKNPVEPSNSVVVKKESKWQKINQYFKEVFSKKSS